MSASVTLHAEDFCTVTGKTDPDSLAFVEADWEIRAPGVLNHPCDNKKFDHDGERTVPNIIIAY